MDHPTAKKTNRHLLYTVVTCGTASWNGIRYRTFVLPYSCVTSSSRVTKTWCYMRWAMITKNPVGNESWWENVCMTFIWRSEVCHGVLAMNPPCTWEHFTGTFNISRLIVHSCNPVPHAFRFADISPIPKHDHPSCSIAPSTRFPLLFGDVLGLPLRLEERF